MYITIVIIIIFIYYYFYNYFYYYTSEQTYVCLFIVAKHDVLSTFSECAGDLIVKKCSTDDGEVESYEDKLQQRKIKEMRVAREEYSGAFPMRCMYDQTVWKFNYPEEMKC